MEMTKVERMIEIETIIRGFIIGKEWYGNKNIPLQCSESKIVYNPKSNYELFLKVANAVDYLERNKVSSKEIRQTILNAIEAEDY